MFPHGIVHVTSWITRSSQMFAEPVVARSVRLSLVVLLQIWTEFAVYPIHHVPLAMSGQILQLRGLPRVQTFLSRGRDWQKRWLSVRPGVKIGLTANFFLLMYCLILEETSSEM